MLFQFENSIFLFGFIPLLVGAYWFWNRKHLYSDKEFYRKFFLYFGVMSFCLIGLARPQLGRQILKKSGAGSNVFLAIDISTSMLSEDVRPNRLTFATSAVERLMDQLTGARVALFPFSGDGFIQIPLTHDYRAVATILPSLSPSITSEQGTDYTVSLESLSNLISKMESAAAERGESWLPTQVILFSDGETHQPIDRGVLAEFRSRNIPVHTVGTGTGAGGSIPLATSFKRRSSYLRDKQGKVVHTRLNKDNLVRIARETGGSYFAADLRAMFRLAKQVNQAATFSKLSTEMKVDKEFYPFLFLIAFFFLLAEFSMGRWEYAIRILLCGLLFSQLAVAQTDIKALESELEKETEQSRKAIRTYNLGVHYEKQKQFERASEYYQESAYLTENLEHKKKALFNLGNSLLQMGRPDEALPKYQEAYTVSSGSTEFDEATNKSISENMALAAEMLKEAAKKQGNKSGDDKGKQGNQSQDRKGPEKDYVAQKFSESRKRRIYDLLATEEQEILKKLRRKRSEKDRAVRPETDKPW